MQKLKVLIVDDNVNLVEMMKEYFFDNEFVEVYDIAYDGMEAINKIDSKQSEYDVVILDLIMPVKDGLYVLSEMKKRGIKKPVIVTTSYNAPDVVKEIVDYKAQYLMIKPFELVDLENRIIQLFKRESVNQELDIYSSNLRIKVTDLLHKMGIPSHIKGYQYLRDAICLVYTDPSYIGGITKCLYPEIAAKYDTSVSRVERAIRHAIEVSWNRGDLSDITEFFGNSVSSIKDKPTNSEFLVTLADRLRLEDMKTQL